MPDWVRMNIIKISLKQDLKRKCLAISRIPQDENLVLMVKGA
jgi:hypothetical protein